MTWLAASTCICTLHICLNCCCFVIFEIVTLIEIYIICIVKAYSKTWRTGARLVGFVINEKKDILLFYNLIQFRYTVHSSLRKVVAICIQFRWHFRFLLSKHMKFAIFIQFAFYYSVQIRPLQKPNCAFTKGSVTHALIQLRTACFRAVTILIWYHVGMCDCATACCLTERGRVVLSFIRATGFCGCISATACCLQLC